MSGLASNGSDWLLVSDIDDTLTGDDQALRSFADVIARHRRRLCFAVNSSRPSTSVVRTLKDVFPPGLVPDAMITALGTEISLAGHPLDEWDRLFTGWPHEQVYDLLSALGHQPHDAEFQTPRKVSFAIPPGQAQLSAKAALARAGIPNRTIASGINDFDVIPESAGKDAATLHLAKALGFDLKNVIVAGDSANDAAMFLAARNRIAVANAREELIKALEGSPYYHATLPHASGVLEGLVHFGALPVDGAHV